MCLDGGWLSDEVKNLGPGASVVKIWGDSFSFPFPARDLSMDPPKCNA